MALHPALVPLTPLIGTWRGPATGEYPTITTFTYTDEWQFLDVGKPFLAFIERTWNAEGSPMHTETGYLRFPAPDVVEIVAALPTGQAELGVGSYLATPDAVTIVTDAEVRNTPSAKRVDRILRRFTVRGDELSYHLEMAAVGQDLTTHLRAQLTRQA